MFPRKVEYVVPAVKDFRVNVGTTFINRHPAKVDHVIARQRWWIHIQCNTDIDLYIFEKTLSGSEIRLIELNDTFYVEDPRLGTANMAEAHQLAETVIAQLNGATRVLCSSFQGVRIESMVEILDNGVGQGSVGFAVAIHGTSEFPAIAAYVTGDVAPINKLLPSLKSDKNVQDALFYLGATGNAWANLYKATEVVEEQAGGGKEVVSKGFCTRAAWERFRRTANHQEAIGKFSRHARSQAEPPPDPMTEAEARLFTGELVKRWLDALIAEQKTNTSP